MTEERKDGKTDKKIKVEKVLQATLEAFQKVIPEAAAYSMVNLLSAAIHSLREYIERGKAGIDWKNPFVQLEYDVDLSEEGPSPHPEVGPIPDLKIEGDQVSAGDVEKLGEAILTGMFPAAEVKVMDMVTHGVAVLLEEGVENGRPYNQKIIVPEELRSELDALPEDKRNAKLEELLKGSRDWDSVLMAGGSAATEDGPQDWTAALVFRILPLTIDPKKGRKFFSILIGLDFEEGDPSAWSGEDRTELWNALFKYMDDLAAPLVKTAEAEGKKRPPVLKPDQVRAVRPEDFAVAGGYVRPIFGLSERQQDLSLLLQFHKPQTPLNWAVGLALFSLTDEDRVRAGDWQEASIHNLEDRVFCLTEREAPRRGDHRTDILAEVVKLHTTRNWYYEIDTVRVGRAWSKRAVIGSQYAIPELQLVFLDMKTGKRAFPTDAAVRALRVPLVVKGRRVMKPDGKDIPALPKGRWKLEAVRWRWVQAFNEDLLLTPALEEAGRRKGLPKKTTTGKTIRKGYLIRVSQNVIDALRNLRAEGSGSVYAVRLLLMLAHNLNKTEGGIAAERVYRMLGMPEDFQKKAHEKPEELVARAVFRLKQRDIGALLPGSDEYPRTAPNPDRRKGPYYRLIRSPAYTPRTGIASKEDAEKIEAEYAEDNESLTGPTVIQPDLPGMEAPPIPSGSDIRAAREAAGLNLRDFARMMEGPSFKTWSLIETGKRTVRSGRITPEVWKRVRDFIVQHGLKTGSE